MFFATYLIEIVPQVLFRSYLDYTAGNGFRVVPNLI